MDNKIIEIISKVTKLPEDELKQKLFEEKLWSSLLHIELVIALEEEFDIILEPEEIADMSTVAQVIKVVEKKVEEK